MHDYAQIRALIESIWPFAVAVPRMLGFFVGMQLLPTSIFPGMVRNAFAIAFSAFAVPLVASDTSLPELHNIMLGVLLVKEVMVGLGIGVLLGLPLALFEGLGIMLDTQTGQNSAATYDPISEHELGPTGALLRLLATVIFLTSGLFGSALGIVLWSYKVWPVGATGPMLSGISSFPVLPMATLFMEKLVLLTFPVIAILLALELSLGFLNRVVQQLNVFSVSMPLKASVGLLVLMIQLMLLMDDFLELLRFPFVAVRRWLQIP